MRGIPADAATKMPAAAAPRKASSTGSVLNFSGGPPPMEKLLSTQKQPHRRQFVQRTTGNESQKRVVSAAGQGGSISSWLPNDLLNQQCPEQSQIAAYSLLDKQPGSVLATEMHQNNATLTADYTYMISTPSRTACSMAATLPVSGQPPPPKQTWVTTGSKDVIIMPTEQFVLLVQALLQASVPINLLCDWTKQHEVA